MFLDFACMLTSLLDDQAWDSTVEEEQVPRHLDLEGLENSVSEMSKDRCGHTMVSGQFQCLFQNFEEFSHV